VLAIGIEYETELGAQTDSAGAYQASIEQTDANYRLVAWIETAFDGETFRFPLEPVGGPDTHFYGADGIARDFIWKLNGRGSWASQFPADDRRAFVGGTIGVFVYDPIRDPTAALAMKLPVGSAIEVKLRPVTPLVDGTTGQMITVRIPILKATGPNTIGEVGALTDVPLARYEATAKVIDPSGGTTDLVIGATCSRSGCPLKPANLSATTDIRFVPAESRVHSRPFQGQPVAGLALYAHTP
jgi:hypothetical protein